MQNMPLHGDEAAEPFPRPPSHEETQSTLNRCTLRLIFFFPLFPFLSFSFILYPSLSFFFTPLPSFLVVQEQSPPTLSLHQPIDKNSTYLIAHTHKMPASYTKVEKITDAAAIKQAYKPTHPGQFEVVYAEGDYNSKLVTCKPYAKGEIIAKVEGITPGPKRYTSVQIGKEDHIELNSDRKCFTMNRDSEGKEGKGGGGRRERVSFKKNPPALSDRGQLSDQEFFRHQQARAFLSGRIGQTWKGLEGCATLHLLDLTRCHILLFGASIFSSSWCHCE